MKKYLTYGLSIIAFVLLCFMAEKRAQARYTAQWALENSGKLELTLVQKAKIEAVKKDLEKQYQDIHDNAKLGRNERKAKFREIKEDERAQVSRILTSTQLRKLKYLIYPKQQWRVNAYITVGPDLAHYVAHLEGYPPEYLSYTVHKRNIRLNALGSHGKPFPDCLRLMLAPALPDVIRPIVNEDGIGVCQIEFTLDQCNAHKPGLYTFQLRATVDAEDIETHEQVKLPDAIASFSVYLTPQPEVAPTLRPGQRFMGAPWKETGASTVTPYRDVKSDKPITWREIAARIATLQRVEPLKTGHRLTFVLEKHTGQIYLETESQVADIPFLSPLMTDTTVRELKAHYEGKQVWCYGGPSVQCITTMPGLAMNMTGSAVVPLRIRCIERIYRPRIEMAIGDATFIGGERESSFVTANPLVVILNSPAKGIDFGGLSYVGSNAFEDDVASNPLDYCIGLWDIVSDRWDFERRYSLTHPFKTHPKWSAKIRSAVLNGEVVKGMTREMVAWARGWPSIYGTKNELLALDDWAYDNIPFQGHIYFKQGRVVRQEWPRLP